MIVATGLTGMSSDYIVTVGDYFCNIEADGVQSNRISCRTSPTGGDVDEKNLPIKVYYNQGIYSVPQDFDYLIDSTPLIYFTYPSAAPSNTLLHFYGKHRIRDSGDNLRDWGDIEGMYVGDGICNLENVEQIYSGNSNSDDYLICQQAKVQEAGKYSVKTSVVSGYSKSDEWMTLTNFEGESYEHVVVPTV